MDDSFPRLTRIGDRSDNEPAPAQRRVRGHFDPPSGGQKKPPVSGIAVSANSVREGVQEEKAHCIGIDFPGIRR